MADAMTNPTLERAARAAYDAHGFKPRDDMGGDLRFDDLANFYQDYWRNSARAVLTAVLPTLNRHGDEGYVYYDDLTAILAEGE